VGEFIKDRLPNPISYFEGEGVRLVGPGRWKTGPCAFHGGRDSLRVNTQSGGWCCMACGAKGGDVLAFHMQMHGMGFVEAARALDAYVDDGRTHRGADKPATLSARDAMQLVANELLVLFLVIADVRAGVIPSDADWQRFVKAAGRVESLAREFA
jgi:DNA primase